MDPLDKAIPVYKDIVWAHDNSGRKYNITLEYIEIDLLVGKSGTIFFPGLKIGLDIEKLLSFIKDANQPMMTGKNND